jgi:hypothetical protein
MPPTVWLTTGGVKMFPVILSTPRQQGGPEVGEYVLYYSMSRLSRRYLLLCGGGVDYLHRNPASRRRRRKGKSRMWDSKLWSRGPRESGPKVIALARTRSSCKRQTCPRQRGRPTSTNPQLSDSNKKSGRKSKMGALFQDRLADWPSVVI